MTGARRGRGLRASVTLAFSLGALGLSTVLAVGTYVTARHYLVEQRERTATRQAYTDGALVRESLLTTGAEVSDVLGSISPPAGAVIYVRRDGEWYSSALDSRGPEMTAEVQPIVADGSAGVGWTSSTRTTCTATCLECRGRASPAPGASRAGGGGRDRPAGHGGSRAC